MERLKSIVLALLLGAVGAFFSVFAMGDAGLESASEKAFLASTQAAMSTMMAGMNAPSRGNVDQDFAVQMIPHHQAAIDMAKAELLYGHNEKLRRLAQEIIVEQNAEIEVMHRELTLAPSPPEAGK